ncbi:glycosyltransferase family 4 protein [Vibrio sp. 10N.222.51.C12]|uniref:glycosyltransferase family 4 protein n=1 Tax=Vibrio sp. 10N.222.51.C12 TaxID=3229622 RepID=UPI00354E5B66
MITIVFTANTSWYLYNFRSSTIKRLIGYGYRVICLSPEDEYSARLVSELGCQWLHLEMDNKGSNPFKDAALFFRFVGFFLRLKPSAVFNFTVKNNIYGTWSARLLGAKVINNVSGLGTAFINSNATSFVVKMLYRLSQPFANQVFCQNPEDYELLVKKGLVSKCKLALLPGSGVNIDRFNPELKLDRSDDNCFHFVYVGRMLGDKGLKELIAASHLLVNDGHNFRVSLCGFADVDNNTAICKEDLAKWSECNYIQWIGASNEIEKVYAEADCVVLPSYREGMPRSLLEAGAMGLPSVASDVPGCKHIITDGFNGLLCDAKSIESLYNALTRMLELPLKEYEQMCKQSRTRIVEGYDEEVVVQEALSALNKLGFHGRTDANI